MRPPLPIVLLIASASSSLAASYSSAEPDDEWITVAPPSETFEVEMPKGPERRAKETSTFVGTVEEVRYRVDDGEQVFLVTRVELPGVATFFLSDDFLLDNIRDSFLEEGKGTENSYVDVEREGHHGKRLDFVMDHGASKEDARAEFFLVDGTMLSFTGIVPQGDSMADVDRFLDTVELDRGE